MANRADSRRHLLTAGAGLATIFVLGLIVWTRLPPPQLPRANEQVFNTVDALFTALTSRDQQRLAECERRLRAYRAAGETSPRVSAVLDAIIQQAHQGEWQPAAERLYAFMAGQQGR